MSDRFPAGAASFQPRDYRADPEKAGIPIIAMTTGVFEKDRIAALAAGMDAFEEKPIFIDKLFETIDRFLHPEG